MKLNKIMLIDDSESDNFIHKRRILKADICNEIIEKYDGASALAYLKEIYNENIVKPDLIFLDINMPGMDGWEFLDEYEKLDPSLKSGIIVAMLTTSTNESDREKANKYMSISSFETKPLSEDSLFNVINKFFPISNQP